MIEIVVTPTLARFDLLSTRVRRQDLSARIRSLCVELPGFRLMPHPALEVEMGYVGTVVDRLASRLRADGEVVRLRVPEPYQLRCRRCAWTLSAMDWWREPRIQIRDERMGGWLDARKCWCGDDVTMAKVDVVWPARPVPEDGWIEP